MSNDDSGGSGGGGGRSQIENRFLAARNERKMRGVDDRQPLTHTGKMTDAAAAAAAAAAT